MNIYILEKKPPKHSFMERSSFLETFQPLSCNTIILSLLLSILNQYSRVLDTFFSVLPPPLLFVEVLV